MCVFDREREKERQIVCVRSVCVGRPQVSGHGVRVLRGLLRGPPSRRVSASVSWGGGAAEKRRRGWQGLPTHTPRGLGACWGAVADKQVPMLTVTLHT